MSKKILLNKIWDILFNAERYGGYNIQELVKLIMIEIKKYCDFKTKFK